MTKKLHTGFNRISPWYDLMLKFSSGNAILKSQTALLKTIPALDAVLIIGGGTGSFLVELLKQNEVGSITYLDLSEGMIQQAQKKIRKEAPQAFSKIKFICGSIDDLAHEQRYDAIFTNYFLDLFEPGELKVVMQKIYGHLSPKAYWYLTDFAYVDETFPALHKPIVKVIHKLLYVFFRTLCGISGNAIPDLKTALAVFELTMEVEEYQLNRLLWSGLFRKK